MARRYDRWFAAYGPRPPGLNTPGPTGFNTPGPTGFNTPGPRMIVNQVHPTRLPITPAGGVRDIYRQAQSGIYDDGSGPKGGRFVGQGIYRQWLPERRVLPTSYGQAAEGSDLPIEIPATTMDKIMRSIPWVPTVTVLGTLGGGWLGGNAAQARGTDLWTGRLVGGTAGAATGLGVLWILGGGWWN